jgi:hypothetical protein
MFIDTRRNVVALRQEGHVSTRKLGAQYQHGPPGGGRARLVTGSINMALLTEGRHPEQEGLDEIGS